MMRPFTRVTMLTLVLLALGQLAAVAGPAGGGFGAGFWWGAAISAHSTEGNHANDWTLWEQMPGKILDGSQSGQADNHWQLYPEDHGWAKKLHLNTLVVSVEWSRLEPVRGQFDDEALTHYLEMVRSARKHGLRPVVVLFDHTLPQWVAAQGGLTVPATILDFQRLAEKVGPALAAEVDEWVPLRDPISLATRAFKEAKCPPGLCDVAAYGKAVAVLIAMQRAGYETLRRLDTVDADGDRQPCAVGLWHGMSWVRPHRADVPSDVGLARAQDSLANLAFLDAIVPAPGDPTSGATDGLANGKPPVPGFDPMGGKGKGGGTPPAPPAGGPLFPRAADFLLIGWKGLAEIKFNVFKPLFVEKVVPAGIAVDDVGQVIHPDSLTSLLLGLKKRGVPVRVVLGVADRAGTRREAYVNDHVRQIGAALAQGVDVRGIIYDPLLDGFDYENGFVYQKGLIGVRREIQERFLAPGAKAFGACAAGNGPR